MKKYIKPDIQIVDMKIKDDVAAATKKTPNAVYSINGKKISYYLATGTGSGVN